MTRTIYAFLVGINDYLGGVNSLEGCVNDVLAMAKFLELRTAGGEFDLKPLILTSGDRANPNEVKPARQGVIDGFRNHLCQAGPDDVAVFYYSGHGSQEKAPPEFWHLEPDHLDETIVCYDSRTEGSWDLADKELGILIAEVAKKQPHILVILDSCHSGSCTRAPAEPGVRLAFNDKRDRPLDTFVGFEQIRQLKPVEPDKLPDHDWLVLPEGKHVVLSACRAEEVANERFLGDGIHGVMSYYLLDALQRAGAGLTYRDIHARVGTLVRNQIAQQNPLIEATDVKELQEPFLGGAVKPQPAYFSVTHSKEKGWVIDGGAVNGIAAPSHGETTTLAVFGATTDLATISKAADAMGWAKVTTVEPGLSRVDLQLKSGETPTPQDSFKAIVVSQPLPPVQVWMQGDAAGLDPVRAALKTAGTSGGPSLIVQELTPQDMQAAAARAGREIPAPVLAPLTLIARDGRYLVRRSDDAYPLMVPVEQGYSASAARMAVQRLEHVARWLQVAQLDNKTTALPVDAVTMEMYAVQDDGILGERLDIQGKTIRLEYRLMDGKWIRPRFKLHLVNNSDRRLYCALLDLTETFAIQTAGLLKGGGEWLEPKGKTGSDIWGYQGKPIKAGIRNELLAQDVVTFRDILKLVVSTTEVQASLLELDNLGVTTRGGKSPEVAAREAAAPKSSLARLYNRVQTRDVLTDEDPDEMIADWTAGQITLTIVHPKDQVNIPTVGQTESLSDTVVVEGHPALKGKARLTTFAEGTRDAGNLALPSVFRQYPALASPFQFSDFRDGGPGLSVLELEAEGDTYKQVSREHPLVVRVAKPVKADEYVLPLAFDPETQLFLPLGRCERAGDQTILRIERLPRPTSTSRDLQGSIKLFFLKAVGEKLGLEGATTRLAAASVNAQGQVEYDSGPASVAEKVKAANRILLYVHGFTGDTRGMVASSRALPYTVPNPPPTLAAKYDLILAYDYESINTPVEQTAIKLKQHLAAVGLGAGHGKTLHMVAHSLGNLIMRWFIEREGGNKVVEKAVLVAPPNKGTPWATIEDWAIVGLGAAINGLAAVIWPPAAIPTLVGVLASIVGGVEKVDTTPDQLKPGSDLLKVLDASDDPDVPYAVIAGNTELFHKDVPQAAKEERALLQQLIDRLASPETCYAMASMAFLLEPNDTTLSVKSMESLPPNWKKVVQPKEIACDHVSYFSTEVGLRALAEALQEN